MGIANPPDIASIGAQPLDEELTDIAGLTPTDNGVIIGNGSAFVVESGATLKTSLGLTINTDIQAYSSILAAVAGGTYTGDDSIATVGTVTAGTWSGSFGAVSGANLTNITAANISSGTAGIDISGNAATATALETARTIGGTSFDGTANIVPGTITVGDTTDSTCSVALFESATGDLAPKTDSGLTYDATTGTITATAFSGPLTGNVTGNASGSSGSCTGNAATATALQTSRTIGGVSFNGTGDITVSSATAGFTVSGGDLALGANNITMSGSLAATGTRVTKGWFTDIESSNAPTIGGTSATGSGGLVRATSPSLVTPTLGVASATSINTGSGAVANIFAGTYSPTITEVTNSSGSAIIAPWQYMRIGDVVNVSGYITLDPAAGGAFEVGASLPIASAIAVSGQVAGTGAPNSTATSLLACVIGDASNDRASIKMIAESGTARNYTVNFTYLIVV